MSTAKILVIDDEESILNLVTAYLNQEGYQYYTAQNGISGLKAAQTYHPDLVVLDINLPGMDGIELLTRLRRESDVYVIMLTAKAEETDKVIGLSVGADDYLTKPFSPRELMARIKAALRRFRDSNGIQTGAVITTAHLRIDPISRQVWVDDELVELTSTEFDLLLILAEQLLEKVWGHDYFGEIRVVDVHLGHVRQKLGEHHHITTVRGVGYRFEKGE
jgi:two-component system alkaline phosphatase synthesis response regulator PhoP